jgi:hypothetical protein
MAIPSGYALDSWVDELTRLAREQAALGRAGTAGMLFDLSNHLAELRDQHRPRRLELSRDWIMWIASESYSAGARPGTPRLAETSANVRDFMVRRTTETIKALGIAHKMLSNDPTAQPPTITRKEGTAA